MTAVNRAVTASPTCAVSWANAGVVYEEVRLDRMFNRLLFRRWPEPLETTDVPGASAPDRETKKEPKDAGKKEEISPDRDTIPPAMSDWTSDSPALNPPGFFFCGAPVQAASALPLLVGK